MHRVVPEGWDPEAWEAVLAATDRRISGWTMPVDAAIRSGPWRTEEDRRRSPRRGMNTRALEEERWETTSIVCPCGYRRAHTYPWGTACVGCGRRVRSA